MNVSFATFYMLLAQKRGWVVPDFHILVCDWLEKKGRVAVLRMFRGAAKSTIVGAYDAWKLYSNRNWRFLVQAADDPTARKMSRDCKSVLHNHPLTHGVLPKSASGDTFWVDGAEDARNPSMNAQGVLSNVTSSRADEVVFDDIEVPKNIKTEDARRQLRERITEATFILTPEGSKLYIGTPHTHESIYDEIEAEGADVLTIPLFVHSARVESEKPISIVPIDWKPEDLYVFHGNRMLERTEYTVMDGVRLKVPVPGLVDVYGGCIWPERFTRDEIAFRRKECKSLNAWDSQYMLISKPVHNVRLNPNLMKVYDAEPIFKMANGEMTCTIGEHRIVGVKAYWDVSLGKQGGDDSPLTILFQDEPGNMFWHRCQELTGDIDEQCEMAADIAEKFKLPAITAETNGVGGFVPAKLRKVLSKRRIPCAVKDETAKGNKDERILGAIEVPLSGGMIYVHKNMNPKAVKQMRDYIPGASQKDDFLDSLSGAILQHPVRLKADFARDGIPFAGHSGSYDVQLAFNQR